MEKRVVSLGIVFVLVVIVYFAYNDANKSTGIEKSDNEVTYTVKEKSNNKDDALAVVDKYIRNDATSRYDLYYILLREDFAGPTIIYAIDNAEVNWKEECLDYAKALIKKDHISKSKLIGNLSDGLYTEEEIDYAMDNLNVDWKNEAVEFIKFCKGGGHSEESFIYQAFMAGFTREEVDYAMDNVEIDYVEECYIKISYYMDINDCDEESTRAELESEGFIFEHINQAFNRRRQEEMKE
jgi:hypothetical protein